MIFMIFHDGWVKESILKNHKNHDNLCSVTALHDLEIDMKESLLLIFNTDIKNHINEGKF